MSRVDKAIERAIKYRNHGILITELFESAKKQESSALKKGLKPFPVVVKDCYLVQGAKASCGSKTLQNFIPPVTATVVQRLVDHGGCVIGKSNLDEFSMGTSSALGYFGPVKGPLIGDDDWVIPGGSSGGSGVAVRFGLADVALGTDTGGSTRNPAAFNGIFGLKPTFGVLSRSGIIPLVNNLDVPAILANSADDCRKFLDIMAGFDSKDSTTLELPGECENEKHNSLKALRIGIPQEYHNEYLTEEAWQVWNHAANVLQKNGAVVKKISLPSTKHSLDCYHVFSGSDIASNMARYDGINYGHRSGDGASTLALYANSRSESLNSVVRRRIMAGNYFLMRRHRHQYVERASRIRRLIANELLNALKEVDIILTPSASGPPPSFRELQSDGFSREDADDFYTQPANLAGVPAISIPFGMSKNGLPLGVQLISGLLRDRFLCTVAQNLYNFSRK